MLGAGVDHAVDLILEYQLARGVPFEVLASYNYLSKPVLSRKSGSALDLHQPGGGVSVLVKGRGDANVSCALLHDDGKDDALLDTDGGGRSVYCVENATDILTGVAGGEHEGLVDVEDVDEGLPLGLRWEVGRRTREECEAHFAGCIEGIVLSCG